MNTVALESKVSPVAKRLPIQDTFASSPRLRRIPMRKMMALLALRTENILGKERLAIQVVNCPCKPRAHR